MVWALGFNLLWEHTRNVQDIRVLASFLHWGPFQLLAAGVVFAVGWLAYWGKKNHQLMYGGLELAVAMGTTKICANGISRDPNTFTRVATIVGAIYIVSRGMENMTKATEGKKRKTNLLRLPRPSDASFRFPR